MTYIYISVGERENGSEIITLENSYKGDIQNVFGINFSGLCTLPYQCERSK
jgi:hypothetical protein